jgi:DNA-binding GntR family transcriptional regulator
MAIDQNAKATTKKDRLVQELRHLILYGELERGARIRQDEVAARFSTSITPVREALRQLEAEGLLESQPHRGVRVAVANISEIKGNYVARRLVEPYVMQRAALRASRLDFDQAQALLDRMEVAAREGDYKDAGKANIDFHFTFLRKSGIPSLSRLVMNLYPGFPSGMMHVVPHRMQRSLQEHHDILAAVEASDLDAVKRTTEAHLRNSYRALAAYLGETTADDPFELDVD